MICKELTINGEEYEIPSRYLLGAWCDAEPSACKQCSAYDRECQELPAKVNRHREVVRQ
jgi:hypothetical protein